MSKVASYLQEHILGEVTTQAPVLRAMSHDASVLEFVPEMVVFPRVTNDIRKVARFCWQLAEKGHVIPITARGGGTDQTGAAIGKGIILSMPAHMNRIFEFDAKQRLVRLQPGVGAKAVNDALCLHGVAIPSLTQYGTVGGAVANNASGLLSGRHGATDEWVYELEVILANGEVLQTGRINKRELSRRKGLQTFEGEIYRNLDNLIEDNHELIATKLNGDIRDNAGYEPLALVKNKDGSFDLTPLFVGSQGTLGIISELIMKAEFVSGKWGACVASFSTIEAARDTLDSLRDLNPTILNYYDGEIFEQAAAQGRKYRFYDSGTKAIVVIGFDDFSERALKRKQSKVAKLLEGGGTRYVSAEGEAVEELLAVCDVTSFLVSPAGKDISAPPLIDGAYVPPERFEDFSRAVSALAVRHRISLPLYGRVLDSVYYARTALQLHKLGDKQKIFKLLDEYSECVAQYGGHLIGEAGEGRVKTRFAYKNVDDDVMALYAAVKSIFDPHGILNPGVKQPTELKQLVASLRADYDQTAILPDIARI
jgi:FAD/FMN-containing dehydrogenase